MTGYPIQPAKVQRPPLRDETLARDRLLDWLAAKIHHRVILILADAGYGKTTLLADFSRRTRVRTLWYRLDDDDRDWMSFLQPPGRRRAGARPRVRAEDGRPAGRPCAWVDRPARRPPNVFLSELPSIAERGAVLILDDFHLVDESPDVRHITRELVARAPERLSIVFASRRAPAIPLARLRTAGEVAELGTDDLRFDPDRDRPPVHRDLRTRPRAGRPRRPRDRTEGWAASLQMVQAALRDRSPGEIRRFVRGLTGADQELYDYLAEEVVGDLPEDLQRFLMRTSILQVVTPDLAGVVTDLDEVDVGRLTAAAERLTLLSRPRLVARPAALPPARARVPRGAPALVDRQRRRRPAPPSRRRSRHRPRLAHRRLPLPRGRRPRGGRGHGRRVPSQTSWASGVLRRGIGVHRRNPTDLRPLVLASLRPVSGCSEGDYEGAVAPRSRPSGQPLGSERDHALLNLCSVPPCNTGDVRQAASLAGGLREATSDADLRLIAEAARLDVEPAGQKEPRQSRRPPRV